MICAIPYKYSTGIELKYCLRGIEKFIEDPEVILIGTAPDWLQNAEVIPAPDARELKDKEANIFRKILQVGPHPNPSPGGEGHALDGVCHPELVEGFLFFNDDHFLLKPFSADTYHFSGSLQERMESYGSNVYRHTIQNTINVIGNADNYFRHAPLFIRRKILEKLTDLDWDRPYGYCVKSLYCHYAGIKGIEYPDLKIRSIKTLKELQSITSGRAYFSTGNHCMNTDMIAFLQDTYPAKSHFEK